MKGLVLSQSAQALLHVATVLVGSMSAHTLPSLIHSRLVLFYLHAVCLHNPSQASYHSVL